MHLNNTAMIDDRGHLSRFLFTFSLSRTSKRHDGLLATEMLLTKNWVGQRKSHFSARVWDSTESYLETGRRDTRDLARSPFS